MLRNGPVREKAPRREGEKQARGKIEAWETVSSEHQGIELTREGSGELGLISTIIFI